MNATSRTSADISPSHVLVLLSDEHVHDMMGCAGHAGIRTPNMDALARRGTRFRNAYTPSPICVPARASLATGRYVHEVRFWDNAIAYDGSTPGWATFLSDEDYCVESIGKLHFRDAEAPVGFARQQHAVHIQDGIGQVWGSVRDPLPESMGRSPLYDAIGPGTSKYNQFDRRVADSAVSFLEAHRNDIRPWVLFVGMVAPHFPLVVPQEYLDLYPPNTVPLPLLHPSMGYVRHPWVARQARHMDHDSAIGSDERRRLAVACYMALISFLDDQLGRILDALDATGLTDSTTVIYSSDHGDNVGKRGMWNKCLMYRESTGVPMIVAGPGVPAGKVSDTPVSLIDLQNTILECTHCVAPGNDSPGKSLTTLARAADMPERTVFSEYHAVGSERAAYMIADARFKYHHYVGMRPELFDVGNDPQELNDLAGDPAYAQVLAEYEGKLRAVVDPEATDAAAHADQAALVARYGGREQALRTGTPAATPVPAA